ncbi:MAG TPA: right-handed parallel beta-helix repeat-containing protein [Candidatus Saccharimonadales bacterium]|jgi:parallel beta-helix repeat protein|nr:right-handed parallel beta-helix repeat-containing protein [Candidatus Saccharimonadales bacterium]
MNNAPLPSGNPQDPPATPFASPHRIPPPTHPIGLPLTEPGYSIPPTLKTYHPGHHKKIFMFGGLAVLMIAIVSSVAFFFGADKGSNPQVNFTIPDTNYSVPSVATFVAPTGSSSAAGTQSAPVDSLGAAVAKTPVGGTIVLRGGTYYNVALGTITKKITIQAYPHETVWLKGSVPVSSWSVDGTTWRHDGWTTQFCQTCFNAQVINPSYPAAGLPDQVFINNQPMAQVKTKAQVSPGKFYVDYAAKAIYVGTNPSGSTVEASTQWKALQLSGAASGSVIRGIGFAQYAPHWNEDQLAAVISDATNVTFENDSFVQSAGTALGVFQAGNKLINSYIGYNGYRGVGMNKTNNMLVQGNTIDNNNTEHFNTSSCGAYCTIAGMKTAHSDGMQIIGNYFRNNDGAGFWCDLGCSNTTMINNVVTGNTGNGLYYEVSSRAIIASNVIAGNGRGVKVSGSDAVRMYNNTFSRNAINLGVYDDGRSSSTDSYAASLGQTWNSTGTEIRNNIFSDNDGSGNVFFDSNAQQVNTPQMIKAMDHNGWYRPNVAVPQVMFHWCLTSASCTSYSSVAALNKATGYEATPPSVVIDNQAANPFFVDEKAANYTLQDKTSTLKTGAVLPADIANLLKVSATEAPHLGALSWKGQNDGDVVTPAPSQNQQADTISPTVSLVTPAVNTKLSGVTALIASAVDNIKVTKVDFYVDNQLIGSASTAPYMVSWGTSSSVNGKHTLVVKAYDAAGNQGTSTQVPIEIQNSVASTDGSTPPPPSGSTVTTLNFVPTDDATIVQASPNAKYGGDAQLIADNSPRQDFLLKFTVNGINGRKVTSASLKLYAVDSGDPGLQIFAAQHNNWNQSVATWNYAPWINRPELATLGPVTAGKTYTVTVSGLVKGDGVYSLRAILPKNSGVRFSSKESQVPPQLTVTVQ